MDKNIIKLDYDKIEKLLKIAKDEKIKITEKKNNKIKLKTKYKIIKCLKKNKKEKIKNSKKKINVGMNSMDIIKLNQNLINDLKKLEDLEDTISTVDDSNIKNYPVNYSNYNLSSSSEEFIETFMN